jgi:hypothetical protein
VDAALDGVEVLELEGGREQVRVSFKAGAYTRPLLSRVTRYPISIWRMTISMLSSPISLDHIPYRYPG